MPQCMFGTAVKYTAPGKHVHVRIGLAFVWVARRCVQAHKHSVLRMVAECLCVKVTQSLCERCEIVVLTGPPGLPACLGDSCGTGQPSTAHTDQCLWGQTHGQQHSPLSPTRYSETSHETSRSLRHRHSHTYTHTQLQSHYQHTTQCTSPGESRGLACMHSCWCAFDRLAASVSHGMVTPCDPHKLEIAQ